MWTEFEIKTQRDDFKKDFRDKIEKHAYLEGKSKVVIEGVQKDLFQYKGPNYFYFVCPEKLIDPNEVPNYAGLIWISEGNDKYGNIKFKKKAPKLHKEKVSDAFKADLGKKFQKSYWKDAFDLTI